MDKTRQSFNILPDHKYIHKATPQQSPASVRKHDSRHESPNYKRESPYKRESSQKGESPHKGESPAARGGSANSGSTPGSAGSKQRLTPGHQQALERMRRGLEKLRRQPNHDEPDAKMDKPAKFVDRQSLEYLRQQESGSSRGVVRTPQQDLIKQGVILPGKDEGTSSSSSKDRGGHVLYHPQPVHPRLSLPRDSTELGPGPVSQSPLSPVSSSAHSDGYVSQARRGSDGDAIRRTHSFTHNLAAFTPPEMSKSRSLQSLRSVQRRRSLPPLQVSREHLEEKKSSISQRLAKKINKYREEGNKAILPSTFSSHTLQFLKDFNVLSRRNDPEPDEAMSLTSLEVANILDGKPAQPTTKEVEEYLECVEADPSEKPKPKLKKSESLKSLKTMSKMNNGDINSLLSNIPVPSKKQPVMGTSLPRNSDHQVEIVYDDPPPMYQKQSNQSNHQTKANVEDTCLYNDITNNNMDKVHHENDHSSSKSSYHLTAVDIPLDNTQDPHISSTTNTPKTTPKTTPNTTRRNVPQTNGFIKRRHSQGGYDFTDSNSAPVGLNSGQSLQRPVTLFSVLRTHELLTVHLEKGRYFKSFGILVTRVTFGGGVSGEEQSVVAVGNVIDGGPASVAAEQQGSTMLCPGDLIVEVSLLFL